MRRISSRGRGETAPEGPGGGPPRTGGGLTAQSGRQGRISGTMVQGPKSPRVTTHHAAGVGRPRISRIPWIPTPLVTREASSVSAHSSFRRLLLHPRNSSTTGATPSDAVPTGYSVRDEYLVVEGARGDQSIVRGRSGCVSDTSCPPPHPCPPNGSLADDWIVRRASASAIP